MNLGSEIVGEDEHVLVRQPVARRAQKTEAGAFLQKQVHDCQVPFDGISPPVVTLCPVPARLPFGR